jgi:hypothetical protein
LQQWKHPLIFSFAHVDRAATAALWHMNTAGCGVVYRLVAVRLNILVDDERLHLPSPRELSIHGGCYEVIRLLSVEFQVNRCVFLDAV